MVNKSHDSKQYFAMVIGYTQHLPFALLSWLCDSQGYLQQFVINLNAQIYA